MEGSGSELPGRSTALRQKTAGWSTGGRASGLGLRLVSAAIGIPIVLLAVFGGFPGVSAIAVAAAALAGWELAGMSQTRGLKRAQASLLPLVLTAASVAVFWFGGIWAAAGSAIAAVVALYAWCSAFGMRQLEANATLAAITLIAGLYFGVFLAHAPALASLDDGRIWLLIAILGTFGVDTGAFFVGRAIGRHKMSPRISPKKTWEGAAGGLAGGVAAVMALNVVTGPGMAWWIAAALGVAIAIVGMIGDLAESALKRQVGVKDSGGLIPGHGGILDRIDSLAPNLAVVYWAALWHGA